MNVEISGARKRSRSKSAGPKRKKARTLVVARPFTAGISKRNIMAGKQFAVLRYTDRFQLDAGTGGVPAVRVFWANGVYDPDNSLGGHQPRGFDQLISVYDHAVVTKAVIKIYGDNNAENSAMLIGVAHRDAATTSVDFRDYLEWGPKKTMWLSQTNSGKSASTLSYTVNPPTFLGYDNPFESELKNSVAGNPVEGSFFHIFAYPGNEGDAQPVNVVIEIEYHTWFIEHKLPPIS